MPPYRIVQRRAKTEGTFAVEGNPGKIDPNKIADRLLRERVQYLKRIRQGRLEMASASEIIYNEGARDNLVKCVCSLMETMGWSAQKALENLKVPEADWPKYLSLL